MPKISVCIPVHNSEIWFAQCVSSIEEQTFKDWEIIAVDDGSTDGIWTLFDYYKKKLGEKFRCFSQQKNLGIARTRNNAVSWAKGEIICVQDADDMSSKERLKKTWDYFKRHKKTDLLYGGFIMINPTDKPIHEFPGKPFNFEELKTHNYIAHGSVAYRKASFDKVKYRGDCAVVDDWFLYYDFVKAGMKIGHMEDILCYHRELMSGVSFSREKRAEVLDMKEKFLKEANADLSSVAN